MSTARACRPQISRAAGTAADRGRSRGYFATAEDGDSFEAELSYILLHQMAAFNSPVWFNVGFEEHPQCSACFILSVDDTMESILDWNTKEGKIFRGGSGSGINLRFFAQRSLGASMAEHLRPSTERRGVAGGAGLLGLGHRTR
jgi:ribonucleoside-diphosphate reductase alpha chain